MKQQKDSINHLWIWSMDTEKVEHAAGLANTCVDHHWHPVYWSSLTSRVLVVTDIPSIDRHWHPEYWPSLTFRVLTVSEIPYIDCHRNPVENDCNQWDCEHLYWSSLKSRGKWLQPVELRTLVLTVTEIPCIDRHWHPVENDCNQWDCEHLYWSSLRSRGKWLQPVESDCNQWDFEHLYWSSLTSRGKWLEPVGLRTVVLIVTDIPWKTTATSAKSCSSTVLSPDKKRLAGYFVLTNRDFSSRQVKWLSASGVVAGIVHLVPGTHKISDLFSPTSHVQSSYLFEYANY